MTLFSVFNFIMASATKLNLLKKLNMLTVFFLVDVSLFCDARSLLFGIHYCRMCITVTEP